MFSRWSPLHKYVLTAEQRRMYAAEKLENFRWISKLVATYSSYVLSGDDLAPSEVCKELAELGQFAELAYSAVPIQFLFENHATLSQRDYPLENYDGLRECIVVDSFRGKFADLPAYVAFRPTTKQLVVSICGTSSLKHVLHDLRAMRVEHPSHRGGVHAGFWDLYQGIKDMLFSGIRKGIDEHSPVELVLTGHSMGGSIAYLLCMDFLADKDNWKASLSVKLAVFGAPRTGDAGLVDYFRCLTETFRQNSGEHSFNEYSVKGYNDGVPALPPLFLGYRHFCKEPIYTFCGHVYRTPASECEHSLFHVQQHNETEGDSRLFPKGGHNYYNGRDLERFARRINWLDRANSMEEGWKDRYIAIAEKSISV